MRLRYISKTWMELAESHDVCQDLHQEQLSTRSNGNWSIPIIQVKANLEMFIASHQE